MRAEILHRLASGDDARTEEAPASADSSTNAASGSATSMNSATSTAPSTCLSATPSAAPDALAPGPSPDLDGARAVLEASGRFWAEETDPEPRRELIQQLFERIWIDGHRIVAVRPTSAFADLFLPRTNNAASEEAAMCKERERRDSNPRPPA
jgi:hypothetical protein